MLFGVACGAAAGAVWVLVAVGTESRQTYLAAALGVALLLWHEMMGLSGKPLGVALALTAAATWALGTQLLRRTKIDTPTLAISFWMTVLACVVMSALTVAFERDAWVMPSNNSWFAIVYNAVLVFGQSSPSSPSSPS